MERLQAAFNQLLVDFVIQEFFLIFYHELKLKSYIRKLCKENLSDIIVRNVKKLGIGETHSVEVSHLVVVFVLYPAQNESFFKN